MQSIDDIQKWETLSDNFMIEKIKIELTLASGTFIVSLAFLSNYKMLFYKGILLLSWLFLIISLITGMWAMKSGILRYKRAAQGKKGELDKIGKELYEKGKVLTHFEAQTPELQGIAFIIGILSFVIFVIFNTWGLINW